MSDKAIAHVDRDVSTDNRRFFDLDHEQKNKKSLDLENDANLSHIYNEKGAILFTLLGNSEKGGMGTVEVALDHRLLREVAMKKVRFELNYGEFQKNFLSEAQLHAKVDHPNIVRILHIIDPADYLEIKDPGVEKRKIEEYIIITELVDGQNLTEYLKANGDPRTNVEIFQKQVRGLASAVDALHENGIIHRDIKPGNILITKEGSIPKLLDFGISVKKPDGKNRLSLNGEVAVTTLYGSPEQLSSQEISDATDIYSLGLIYFEMLTGNKYFNTYGITNGTQLFQSRLNDQLPTNIALLKNRYGTDYGGQLEVVFQKCLSNTPDDRHDTATELAEEILTIFDAYIQHMSSSNQNRKTGGEKDIEPKKKGILEIIHKLFRRINRT